MMHLAEKGQRTVKICFYNRRKHLKLFSLCNIYEYGPTATGIETNASEMLSLDNTWKYLLLENNNFVIYNITDHEYINYKYVCAIC